MKYVLFFILAILIAPFAGLIFNSPAWSNPHRHFLGVKNERKASPKDDQRPDLSGAKAERYFTMSISKNTAKWEGMLTIRPQSDGTLKFGSGFILGKDTSSFTLADISVTDKGNYFELDIKPKNANALFGSKISYMKHENFPVGLMIRTNPDNGKPTVVLTPESIQAGYRVKFQELKEPVEKQVTGKWYSNKGNSLGDWYFDINKSHPFQVNGTVKRDNAADEKPCWYPIYGFPLPGPRMLILTGDSVENAEACEHHGWVATVEGDGLDLEDIHASGDYGRSAWTLERKKE